MRVRFQINKGLESYIHQLERLTNDSDRILKETLYKGAGDARIGVVRALLYDLPRMSEKTQFVHNGDKKLRGLTGTQLSDLLAHTGISKFESDGMGGYNVKVGVDGYMEHYKTRKWPNGVPALLLARAIERGTSFREPTPVIKKAMPKIRKEVIEAMKKRLEEEIEKRMK